MSSGKPTKQNLGVVGRPLPTRRPPIGSPPLRPRKDDQCVGEATTLPPVPPPPPLSALIGGHKPPIMTSFVKTPTIIIEDCSDSVVQSNIQPAKQPDTQPSTASRNKAAIDTGSKPVKKAKNLSSSALSCSPSSTQMNTHNITSKSQLGTSTQSMNSDIEQSSKKILNKIDEDDSENTKQEGTTNIAEEQISFVSGGASKREGNGTSPGRTMAPGSGNEISGLVFAVESKEDPLESVLDKTIGPSIEETNNEPIQNNMMIQDNEIDTEDKNRGDTMDKGLNNAHESSGNTKDSSPEEALTKQIDHQASSDQLVMVSNETGRSIEAVVEILHAASEADKKILHQDSDQENGSDVFSVMPENYDVTKSNNDVIIVMPLPEIRVQYFSEAKENSENQNIEDESDDSAQDRKTSREDDGKGRWRSRSKKKKPDFSAFTSIDSKLGARTHLDTIKTLSKNAGPSVEVDVEEQSHVGWARGRKLLRALRLSRQAKESTSSTDNSGDENLSSPSSDRKSHKKGSNDDTETDTKEATEEDEGEKGAEEGEEALSAEEVEREAAIAALEGDAEFMGEFEALVAMKREARGSRRRHRRGVRRTDLLSPNPPSESGTASPTSSRSRSRSRSHSRQTADQAFIKQNIALQKDVINGVRTQPMHMRSKLKALRLAKSYIVRYEGELSRSQGYQQAGQKYWERFRRELGNVLIFFIPWEMRIKLIESHFGSVVASYFTFLRWLVWINLLLSALTMGFVVIPEILSGDDFGSTPRKRLSEKAEGRALNLDTVWNFEGYLKTSVLFYGYYGHEEALRSGYRLPLAYLLTGGATFAVSFFLILRKMAVNARQSRASLADEEFTFSWRLFSSWDYMIGTAETARNKVAEITTLFRESIVEEQERSRREKLWVLFLLRFFTNILVVAVLASSTYAIYLVVDRSAVVDARVRAGERVGWLQQNMVAVVTSVITSVFPSVFELLGLLERYHPRQMLRWQLARILVLYLLNLYTLVVALYWKIKDRTDEIEQRAAVTDNLTPCDNVTITTVPGLSCTGALTTGITTKTRHTICWETELGQEMFKLTVFDLVLTVITIVLIDLVRGLLVRHCNRCCCWDLERKFPEYGEFKLAENILHLINNQAMVWLGAFYAPVLPALNVLKLVVMMYLRSWAVLMCNIPHERIFKAARSNNFFLALLLMMLFLVCVLFIFLMIQLPPSPDCGPFSDYARVYLVLTEWMEITFPGWLNSAFDYIASPGAVLPLVILLLLSIFYLISVNGSLKEANKALRNQIVQDRAEDRNKTGKTKENSTDGGEIRTYTQH